ncbi:WXG100 family type VII secretion target [Streptomyces sp. NPDC092296]|uniref:WXG100 family type VII secretion target n=1 Tax=Streptomyces sp. NPDC092296 TaxID=3366012 RepID=UPI0037FC5A04
MSDKVSVPTGTTSKGITNFEHWDLIPIKQMVENSRPERLEEVAGHWMSVKAELDAASRDLKAATDHITAHWEGSAADGFAQRSAVLQESITNTGLHAQNTSHALTYASQSLQVAKTDMASIHLPSTWEKGKDKLLDGKRDDTRFRADIAAGMDRDTAVQRNAGSLSLLEERHQQAIAVMERLAPQYKSASQAMQPPPDDGIHDPRVPYPPAPPTPIRSPGDVGPAPKSPRQISGGGGTDRQQVGTQPTYRSPNPIGNGLPTAHDGISTQPTHSTGPIPGRTVTPITFDPISSQPPARTGIDGTGGGVVSPTGPVPSGLNPGSGGGGGGGGFAGGDVPGGGFGSGGTGGGFAGGGGFTGGTVGGGTTGGGRGSSGTSSIGGRAGGSYEGGGSAGGRAVAGESAAGQGRAGGGMGGMGGAGGARAGGGARGSSLARRTGGAIGGSSGKTGGAFTEGGSGLGRNRGTGAGSGSARGGGAPHGAGTGGQRKKDKKGSRPDYLVEDEDTWTNGTGPVNPPVVE